MLAGSMRASTRAACATIVLCFVIVNLTVLIRNDAHKGWDHERLLSELGCPGEVLSSTVAACEKEEAIGTTINQSKEHSSTMHAMDATESVGIVTAFSDNHLLEAVQFLRTLIYINYQGPITIFVLRGVDEVISEPMKDFQKLFLSNTTLGQRTTFFDVEVSDFMSYCFKPTVIQDYLYHTRLNPPKVLLWADASVRFRTDNSTVGVDLVTQGANRMLDDGVALVAAPGMMGMTENTHPATYAYLGVNSTKYHHRREVSAAMFMINLRHPSVVDQVLHPWLSCGIRACYACMAPNGTTKETHHYTGPGGLAYVAHRQDQSVLGVLALEFAESNHNSTKLSRNYLDYLAAYLDRLDAAMSVGDLLKPYKPRIDLGFEFIVKGLSFSGTE